MSTKFSDKVKTFSVNKLFANNRFLMIFSLLLSIIFWFSISMTVSNEVTKTVSSIPVKIDLNSYGIKTWNLTIFGEQDFTVDVEITGENYRVRQVTADDIIVTAQTSLVESEGKTALPLSYKLADGVSGFTISKVSPAYIDVYFDVSTTQYFTVEPKVTSAQLAAENCEVGDYALSTSMVKITGPQTEINKIKKVYAMVDVTSPISQTTTFDCIIQAQDDLGNEPKYLQYEETNDVKLTIPILKVKKIPVTVDFINVPEQYKTNQIPYTLDHEFITVTAPASSIDSLEVVNLGEIDFNKLSVTTNTFKFLFSLPVGFNVVGDESLVTVNVDMTGFRTQMFEVDKNNFEIENLPASTTVEILTPSIENVNVVGPEEEISKLTNDDIYVSIDLKDVVLSNSKEQTVQAKLYVKDNDYCWVYGTYNVKISSDKK